MEQAVAASRQHARNHAGSRVVRVLGNILFGVALAAVLFAAITYAGLQLLGVRFYEVSSGSMRPTLDVGDVVAVKSIPAHEIKKGDVIAFKRSGFPYPFIHRVEYIGNPLPDVETVLKNPEGKVISTHWQYAHRDFYTKGDANAAVDGDPVPQEKVLGKMLFSVPQPFNLLASGLDRGTLLALGVGAIGLFIAWELMDGVREGLRKRNRAAQRPEEE
jgi:signal peptidase